MLATVMERTQEIGIRRAVGGRRSDIMGQFVTEAMAMSITGGLIGVFLGIILSLGIGFVTEVRTISHYLLDFHRFRLFSCRRDHVWLSSCQESS